MTYKAYLESIKKQTGKTPEDFVAMARKKGFIRGGELVAKYSDVMVWLKSEVGLGHGHANAIILYLKSPELAKKKIESGE
jgi:hypothetical protein